MRINDERWTAALNLVIAYAAEHGHTEVPSDYTTATGYHLGQWLSDQRRRARRGVLPAPYVRRLTDVGVNPAATSGLNLSRANDAKWDQSLQRLEAFKAEHGHANPTQRQKSPDGYLIGVWLTRQRGYRAAGTLSESRYADLTRLGVEFDPDKVYALGLDSPNRDTYAHQQLLDTLARFEGLAATGLDLSTLHRGTPVPAEYAGAADRLASWRSLHAQGRLDLTIVERATALGLNLNPPTPESFAASTADAVRKRADISFAKFLAALQEFIAEHGHDRVPSGYKTPTGYCLYMALWSRRKEAKNGTFPTHHNDQLLAIGVDLLNPGPRPEPAQPKTDPRFDQLIAEIHAFTDEHGHTTIPTTYRSNTGYHLGSAVQRRIDQAANGTLPDHYRDRLTAAGIPLPHP